MDREKLYRIMDQGNLGYACIFKTGENGMHKDYMFNITSENIACLNATYANEADRIIVTDICDQFVCESVYGGILSNCQDQELCRDILKHLLPYQMGDQDPDDLMIATKEEMEELWHEEEVEVMRAELRML